MIILNYVKKGFNRIFDGSDKNTLFWLPTGMTPYKG